jgi:hypothetical protein
MNNVIIRVDFKSLIYKIRGYKVMLDLDLANLYGVETKRLKEQVRRNLNRFPEDFMFILTNEEFKNLRSHFATSSWGGSRYEHMVFTEQGVAMLSSVINSERAIKVNIEIMRAFVSYRALLLENNELKNEIRSLDEKINKIFDFLLEKIDALHQKESDKPPKKFIGYKNYGQENPS